MSLSLAIKPCQFSLISTAQSAFHLMKWTLWQLSVERTRKFYSLKMWNFHHKSTKITSWYTSSSLEHLSLCVSWAGPSCWLFSSTWFSSVSTAIKRCGRLLKSGSKFAMCRYSVFQSQDMLFCMHQSSCPPLTSTYFTLLRNTGEMSHSLTMLRMCTYLVLT